MKKIILGMALQIFPLLAHSQYFDYAPGTLNIPMLAQKKDLSASIGWGRGIGFQALELQGVYSPIPHLAIMGNYFGAPRKKVRQMDAMGTDAHYLEAGIGAYKKLGTFSASLFAGYGWGRFFSNYQLDGPELNSTLWAQRLFLQPGLHYRKDFFEAALGFRLSRMAYSGDISYSLDPYYLQFIRNLEAKTPFFLPEIGIQAGVRLSPVTIAFRITSILTKTNDLNFVRLNANVSLSTDLVLKEKSKGAKGE